MNFDNNNNNNNFYESVGNVTKQTTRPIVTGTSIIGFKYRDGIMIAADNLASYGSLARFKSVERIFPVGEFTCIAGSGDLSDFQYIKHLLESLMIKENYIDDGHVLTAPHIHEYLTQILYGRRSKLNPLWNSLIIGGFHDGEGYLGYADLLGTAHKSSTIATGLGTQLMHPLLRKSVEGRENEVTEEEAIEIVNDCMRVSYYRDARSLNKFQRAKITAKGFEITEPYSVDVVWHE
ncbi:hypothetical protein Glove_457g69 [Diversispora epigaea]|uniref:Proteasome subunit beta n=1 Tax=Diversispora epigaea TaxID=1348612 RepID=A0A397GXJ3_9GLOM|nr:hypothetical protein Glove_457g69 [Diversispora epigaea]